MKEAFATFRRDEGVEGEVGGVSLSKSFDEERRKVDVAIGGGKGLVNHRLKRDGVRKE